MLIVVQAVCKWPVKSRGFRGQEEGVAEVARVGSGRDCPEPERRGRRRGVGEWWKVIRLGVRRPILGAEGAVGDGCSGDGWAGDALAEWPSCGGRSS